jgi:hypothetical protein
MDFAYLLNAFKLHLRTELEPFNLVETWKAEVPMPKLQSQKHIDLVFGKEYSIWYSQVKCFVSHLVISGTLLLKLRVIV